MGKPNDGRQMQALWTSRDWPHARAEIAALAESAMTEFSDIADYIWKSPRLLLSESLRESEKLEQYFPGKPGLQNLRWRLEQAFPFLIAQGNLLSVVSAFEIHLLLLVKTLEGPSGVPLDAVRGQGVSRCITYIKQLGVDVGSIAKWEQLTAALAIRNLFVHASGSLALSRDAERIRDLVNSARFLEPEVRKRRQRLASRNDVIQIVDHPRLGERLQVSNEYPHYLSAVLRDCFLDICSAFSDQNAG